jgi:predicted ArsR family transcriptional regulator
MRHSVRESTRVVPASSCWIVISTSPEKEGPKLHEDLEARLSSIGSLAEPARRELYLFVLAQADPVSREQAAEALGMPPHTVKFHLERLVTEGLLDVEYRRLSGRTGPGAGRTAKLYRAANFEVAVSLPERRYDVLATLLAEAFEAALSGDVSLAQASLDAARKEGARMGQDAVAGGAGTAPCLELASTVLAEHGYAPRIDGDTVSLMNCPFHRLSREHTELVCGMNHALISGLMDHLTCRDVSVQIVPAPDRCCVQIRDHSGPPASSD